MRIVQYEYFFTRDFLLPSLSPFDGCHVWLPVLFIYIVFFVAFSSFCKLFILIFKRLDSSDDNVMSLFIFVFVFIYWCMGAFVSCFFVGLFTRACLYDL